MFVVHGRVRRDEEDAFAPAVRAGAGAGTGARRAAAVPTATAERGSRAARRDVAGAGVGVGVGDDDAVDQFGAGGEDGGVVGRVDGLGEVAPAGQGGDAVLAQVLDGGRTSGPGGSSPPSPSAPRMRASSAAAVRRSKRRRSAAATDWSSSSRSSSALRSNSSAVRGRWATGWSARATPRSVVAAAASASGRWGVPSPPGRPAALTAPGVPSPVSGGGAGRRWRWEAQQLRQAGVGRDGLGGAQLVLVGLLGGPGPVGGAGGGQFGAALGGAASRAVSAADRRLRGLCPRRRRGLFGVAGGEGRAG
ncbi:hypothetical protein ID875_24625, partial [Streptomyces globisporus]|nr:hypothetical protein [Streptomyces globisporus]